MRRTGLRLRLWLTVVVLGGGALAAAIVGFNVLLAGELGRSGDNLVRSRASAQLDAIRTSGGRIVTPEPADDGTRTGGSRSWIFGAQGEAIEAPLAPAAVSVVASSLATGPSRFADIPDADLRLFSLPVTTGGRRIGTVVAEVSLAPYEETRETALLYSLGLAGAVVLLLGATAWWLLRASLRPVRQMTRQAAVWSAQDAAGRFALGEPHDELTELAATLDTLLERVAASLRHEQRFSAELSHELRTPLAGLIAEAELALRRERGAAEYRESLEKVLASGRKLARTVEALVAAARAEAGGPRGTTDAAALVDEVVEACRPLAREHGIALVATPSPAEPLRIGADADLAERIVQPILENACRYGRSRVGISVAGRGTSVVIGIDDDGPGIAEAERELIFEPGQRGTAGAALPGAGLGLALARRLARSASGDVQVVTSEAGTRFEIALPRA